MVKKCKKCGKGLRLIGTDRKNGREFLSQKNKNKDWWQRDYHKKCWKEIKEHEEFLQRCEEARKKWKAQEKAQAWLDMLEEEMNEKK